jgi:predicted phage baseplate assembly protein
MKPNDLTRWNRAGLSRFRYVDGNAVTYLEQLRARLADAYTAPGDSLPRWSDLVTRHLIQAGETRGEREARLIAQYEDVRRDHGWEILRSFARSTHVLTEHLDAYANEGFIGTATQWDSVRKLIELLDARPAPPASARTDLALDAKDVGTLVAGFQVKNEPSDGSAPAIFETIAPLDVDPALNLLRPTDWNLSQVDFLYAAAGDVHFASFPLTDPEITPTVGEIAVLDITAADGVSDPTPYGVQIQPGTAGNVIVRGQGTADSSDLSVKRWQVSLHAGAKLVQLPRLAGPDVVILTPEHTLAAGRSTVTWADGATWRTAKVMEIDGDRVRLAASTYPNAGDELFAMVQARSQVLSGSATLIIPSERGASGTVWSLDLDDSSESVQAKIANEGDSDEYEEYQYVTGLAVALYVPGNSEPVAQVEVAAPSGLVLGGKVDDIKQGDWIVSAGADLQAVRIDAVTERDGDTVIETTPAVADLQVPVHLNFAKTYRPFEHDMNRTLAFDNTSRSDQVTRLWVSPDPWPALLIRGRQITVQTDGLAHAGEITAVDADAGFIEVKPAIPGTELTDPTDAPSLEKWSTIISGNVVTADHGESQPLKILGSGDATQSGQVFAVKAQNLSFVTDPMMPAGVRAAVDIFVGQRQWEQVANLRDSGQTDAHYEVRINEDGNVTVHFGDGRNGRRLPTQADNVRHIWRKGVGPTGNLAAGSLKKIVQPDPKIDTVRQPLASAGGAGTEGVASLRDNAATGLLTLGRAVSVSDFGKLATQNAQVLQAVSYTLGPGSARGQAVAVVVVPAGGRMGTLGADLLTFLSNNGLPGVTIDVQAYVPLPLSLSVTLKVKSAAYDPDKVAKAVRAAIIDAYALENTKLGAPLFRSQILHLIEGVEGVENATATLLTSDWDTITPAPLINDADGTVVRSIKPQPNQMIHYDPLVSTLTIITEEYSL